MSRRFARVFVPAAQRQLKRTSQRPALRAPVRAHDRALLATKPHGSLLSQKNILELQRTVGNRAVAKLLSRVVQRQPTPASARDRADFIESTIQWFTSAAGFWSGAKIDQARFDRVIDNWYSMVNDRENTIDTELQGDPGLKRRLHGAYIAAIRTLMSNAARQLGKTEDDLYRENIGRIPMWAWQTAHHTETNISTPIAEGRSADVITGEVHFDANGIQVTIARDRPNDPSVRSGAKTNIALHWISHPRYQWEMRGGKKIITAFDPLPAPTARIQSSFSAGSSSVGRSGYGRGTTPQDVAGGRVTPRSTSVGFHEGSHGLDFVRFLEQNAPPRFTGAVGMTEADFLAAGRRLDSAWKAYNRRVHAVSTANTDCVGTTIDQFHQAQAGRGARITRECP
jgi:hypothetical protein